MTTKTTDDDLKKLVTILKEIEQRERFNKINTIFPDTGPYRRDLYRKHIQFINATANHKEVIFMAGNRTGKTLTAAYFVACAVTGIYPPWWKGKKWKKGIRVLVAGKSSKTVRDIIQYELIGDPMEPGTGLIPKDILDKGKVSSKPGTPNAVEMVSVPTPFGDYSTILFTSYDQDFKAIRGLKLDLVWFDEECPLDYYTEGLMRTMTTNGIVLTTFTPDEGLTETVQGFLTEGRIVEGSAQSRYLVNVTWDEAPHLTQEQKDSLYSAIPPHLRAAKIRGVPAVGSGAIYPVDEADITVKPFDIPIYWPKFFGLDVGWDHPTAAVWFAWDRDSDILYIYSEYKLSKKTPREHALAIRDRGAWIPGVIDPSSSQSSKADGIRLIDLYCKEGLSLQYADNTVESGIMTCLTRFNSGRLKIFSTCTDILTELRLYRREPKGDTVHIVKKNDDLMDAMRYGVMSGLIYSIAEYEVDSDTNVIPFTAQSRRNSITGY